VPEVGFPKTVGKPVDGFGFLFVRTANHKTVGKWFFLGFPRVHSFVEDKDLVSLINSVFLVGLDDEVWHSVVGLKNQTSFFEKKKEKKRKPFKEQ
jgi:hypothetical protein